MTNSIPSNLWRTAQVTAGTTELNFDHEFLAPSDIEGDGFVSFTILDTGTGSTQGTIRLIKVAIGGAETELVAALSTAVLSDLTRRYTITMTIPTTHFAVGEKLRLEFILTVAGASATGYVYHDPANRGSSGTDTQTNTAAGTTLDVTIPFRIPV